MDVGQSDLSQMRWSSSDLIENAERFARIKLDQSGFENDYANENLP